MLKDVCVEHGDGIESWTTSVVLGHAVEVLGHELHGVDLPVAESILQVSDVGFDDAQSLWEVEC